jgi:hypothetical protein
MSAEGGKEPVDADSLERGMQALTTQHFTLQSARAMSVADANGRAALFMTTLSATVVALALVANAQGVDDTFFLFAVPLLLAVFILGVSSYARVLQTAIEDLFHERAIERIHRFYARVAPVGDLLQTGPPGHTPGTLGHEDKALLWHLLSHTATAVAAVDSLVLGTLGGLGVGALGNEGTVGEVAAACSLAAVTFGLFMWHHAARWRASTRLLPPLE